MAFLTLSYCPIIQQFFKLHLGFPITVCQNGFYLGISAVVNGYSLYSLVSVSSLRAYFSLCSYHSTNPRVANLIKSVFGFAMFKLFLLIIGERLSLDISDLLILNSSKLFKTLTGYKVIWR